MSTNLRLIGLIVSGICLPVALASAKSEADNAASHTTKACATKTKLTARHHMTRFSARTRSRPAAPSPLTAELNSNELQVVTAMKTNGDYRAQLTAYQTAKDGATAGYQGQLAAWQTAVFANIPPGYHVELASVPPGYHLEPASTK
jgi:hypothetical protein